MGDILLFHANDGNDWSTFITNKLVGPYYKLPLQTVLFQQNEFEFSAECNVQVLLLTPDLLEAASQRPSVFLGLIPERCVVILLGVDKYDVERCLSAGGQSEHLFACKLCSVTNDNDSVTHTLVTIIETFEEVSLTENDDDIYSVPPTPRQINQIYQIIPSHAIQGEDVYVLLDRKAKTEVKIQFDQSDEGIAADCMDKVVYRIKVPENVHGKLNLGIISDDQMIGQEEIIVESKLENMRNLLEELTEPTKFMCQALGLNTYNVRALDEALLHRLKSKSSTSLFKTLLNTDDLEFTDEIKKTTWPTLLHFAADYNLVKFAQELLKYPGVIIAACTENIDGDYPSNIAESRGHQELEQILVNFVLEKQNGNDSGILDPNTCDLPPPSPHQIKHHDYINKHTSLVDDIFEMSDDEDYVKMELPKADLSKTVGNSSEFRTRGFKAKLFGSNRSASESDSSKIVFVNADDLPKYTTRSPFQNIKISDENDNEVTKRREDEDEDAIYSVPPSASPMVQPRFRLDLISQTSSQRSSTISTSSSTSVKVETLEANSLPSRPATMLITAIDDSDSDTRSTNSNMLLTVPTGSKEDIRGDKCIRKNKSIQGMITSYIRRIKHSFKSPGDLPKNKVGKKTRYYGRASDPGFGGNPCLQPTLAAMAQDRAASVSGPTGYIMSEPERDSGSFSEEEDNEVTPLKESNTKKITKKMKNSNNGALMRNKSVRVTQALKEKTIGAPCVPIKP